MLNNKMKYISNYNKKYYKMYQFRIKKNETEIIDKLDNMSNRNNYIASLIKENINPSILTIKQIKDRIKPIMAKHNIDEVYLFGSYARGEARSDSDVDIYCSSGDVRTLYDEIDFIEELEQALAKKVDVVTIGSEMHDYFKEQLEEDKIRICWM